MATSDSQSLNLNPKQAPAFHAMFKKLVKKVEAGIFYLWNGETREEHDRTEREYERQQAEFIRLRKEYERRQEECERKNAIWRAEQDAIEAEKRKELGKKEDAYRRFLETNEITPPPETPTLDHNELRAQRSSAMRFAKDMQDSMPD